MKKFLAFQPPTVQPPLLPTHRRHNCTIRDTAGSALPHELLLRLFAHLNSPKDRAACRQVCKAWHDVMDDRSLWVGRSVCLKRLHNVPQYCWDLLKKRRPSHFQVRLSAKTPQQLQVAFQQLQLLMADTPNMTSLHLLVNSNIDFTEITEAMAIAVFGRLHTLAFSNVSSDSKSLKGLETALAHATILEELEISGFRRFNLLSASHPDLLALKLNLREEISPTHLSALLKRLPRLKQLELSVATAPDGKSARKKSRLVHPWFLADDEDVMGPLDASSSQCAIETLVLRCIRNVQNSEVITHGLPARMDGLTSLSILDCDFSKEALVSLVTGHSRLVHLDLSGNLVLSLGHTHHHTYCICSCTCPSHFLDYTQQHAPPLSFRDVHPLTGTQCSDDVLLSLNCPLQSLELRMCVHITVDGLRHVSKMVDSDLTHLGMSHCSRVDPDVAPQLPSMFPSLTSLDLRCVHKCYNFSWSYCADPSSGCLEVLIVMFSDTLTQQSIYLFACSHTFLLSNLSLLPPSPSPPFLPPSSHHYHHHSFIFSGWDLSLEALNTITHHTQLRTLILRDVNTHNLKEGLQVTKQCSIIT